MIAALDLASGQMFYRFRDRKRRYEFLDLCKQVRARFPSGAPHVICDNFSPHRHYHVTARCTDHDIEPAFTPTPAS